VRSAQASTTSRACPTDSSVNEVSWSLVKQTTSHRPSPANDGNLFSNTATA
jgi:hypothetical protein